MQRPNGCKTRCRTGHGKQVPSVLQRQQISRKGERKAAHALPQCQKAVVHPRMGQAEQVGGKGGQHRRQRRVAERQPRIHRHDGPALRCPERRRQRKRSRKQSKVGGAAANVVAEHGHQHPSRSAAHAAQYDAPQCSSLVQPALHAQLLYDVLEAMKKKENTAVTSIDPKKATPEQLREYLGEVLPNFDRERVYVADIKKLISWYNILISNGITEFKSEPEAEEEVATDEK